MPRLPAAGTKNSMTATAGAIPVPGTNARLHGAAVATIMAAPGHATRALVTMSIKPAQPDPLGERRGHHDQ